MFCGELELVMSQQMMRTQKRKDRISTWANCACGKTVIRPILTTGRKFRSNKLYAVGALWILKTLGVN